MKVTKYILSLIFAIAAAVASITAASAADRYYAEDSKLKEGKWVKIRVKDEGIYQLTAANLKSMGFTDISKVKVYGYGGELLDETFKTAKYIDDLPEVPTILYGDRIIVYLRGTLGFQLTTNNMQKLYMPITFNENYASDYSYYFITDSGSDKPKRLNIRENGVNAAETTDRNTTTFTTFNNLTFKKFDEYNLIESGRNWVGEIFTPGQTRSYTLSFDAPLASDTIKAYSMAVVSASVTTGFAMTYGNQSINGIGSTITEYVLGRECPLGGTFITDGRNTVPVKLKYTSTSASGRGYIDYIVLTAKCELHGGIGSNLFIREIAPSTTYSEYRIGNASESTVAIDVTNAADIYAFDLHSDEDTASFYVDNHLYGSKDVMRFVVFDKDSYFASPEVVGTVANQNLHALKDIEYVILSADEFVPQAKEIAQLHEKQDGMSYAVVTQSMIFNEFSSGTPDPTAVRAFMRMLFDKANVDSEGILPRYLLVFGDGSFDLKNNGKNPLNTSCNKVLTYQAVNSLDETSSFTSDDYFGYLASSSLGYNYLHQNVLNIGVGRIPVETSAQADQMVQKISTYMKNTEHGMWKKKAMIMADDNDSYNVNAQYYLFTDYAEEVVDTIQKLDSKVDITRVYWDSYTREVSSGSNHYPDVEKVIADGFSDGVLYMNYMGHSSMNSFSAERCLTLNSTKALFNKRQPLWFTASCNFCQFDAYTNGIGEELVMNPNGGAIAIVGANRTAYAKQNQYFNLNFVDALYNPENEYRIGEIYRVAKNRRGSDTNKRVYCLLGDPALRLVMPEYEVHIDSAMILNNGEEVASDTFGALSHVKVYGSILNENKDLASRFNGEVTIYVQDKKQTVSTLGNNSGVTPYSYDDYVNTLFSGSAIVEDGKFSFLMVIPKDINYRYGNCKISCYASNTTDNVEALGSDTLYIIGGSSDTYKDETDGPKIRMYLNTTKFNNGDKVNDTPMLYAEISDENGINSSGCGIGHDIILTIDQTTQINLNSRFSYNLGSCTEGSVAYQLSQLTPGRHTITIKAWDLLNNSSVQTIAFYVATDDEPEIEEIEAYPVPATDAITFRVKTDRPSQVLELRQTIADMSGRIHFIHESTEKSEDGYFLFNINLKGGQIGSNLAPGIYIYRVEAKQNGTDFGTKTKKIIILPE